MPETTPAYKEAKARYAALGVDADAALARLATLPVSLQCWQGDDVAGFESKDSKLQGGGLLATGDYPGAARSAQQLRQDLETALSLIPGKHRVNLHAIYGEFGGAVDRDQIELKHFQGWIDWAKARGLGLDFNPTYFSHPKAASGWTLSHADAEIRAFWVEHGKRCRRIAAAMGRQLGTPSVCNVWIPDGSKDQPADRQAPRQRLRASLDALFAESFPRTELIDTCEAKLFGLGSESYVTGSHEFYLGYAVSHGMSLCLDSGHFHPTELISDKISSVAEFVPSILLQVSRGVRWDSDHVVILDDELQSIARELVRGGLLDRSHLGLDYFDATLNRVAAWVIGTRSLQKALLMALLEPSARLKAFENAGSFHERLGWMEDLKALPWGAVWEEFCRVQGAPGDFEWLEKVRAYESTVQSKRSRD
ncbi:MAG: L-rhamnose isomerase [candidate division FCPU426 bacterium]